MKYETEEFKNCTFLKVGDVVILSDIASRWKFGNTTTPQYKVDDLVKGVHYRVIDTTPILKMIDHNQQFLSVDAAEYSTYPCWCFKKV
jgi:hypothetical protein